MSPIARGVLYSVLSSVLFALLYYVATLMDPLDGTQVFAWRILLGLPALAIVISRARGWSDVGETTRRMAATPSFAALMVLGAGLIGVQLWLFVWAPVHGHGLEVSLAYFLLPLFMVVVGRFFYAERLTFLQRWAVAFAVIGVAHELWRVGGLSWVTACVVFGYPPYFMLRRYLRVRSLSALWYDMAFLLPVALAVMYLQPLPLWDQFSAHPKLLFFVPLAGLISALALVFYLSASRLLPLGLFGILSYVEPVLLFLVSLLLLAEPISAAQWFTYVPIWLAVALVAVEGAMKSGLLARGKKTGRHP